MKILWINPVFPYPLYSGGQIRAYHLIKSLAKKHEVTLFSFLRPEREQGPIGELEKFCGKVKTFPGRKTWTIQNVALAGLSPLPFAASPYWGNLNLKKAIKEELKTGEYDLVHFESFYTSPYLKNDLGVPVVMGNENIESLIYERFVDQKKNSPLKTLLSFDVGKMKRYEESVWKKADLNLVVSEKDARKIRKVTKGKCVVVPNGVDSHYFENFKVSRTPEDRPDLLFVGDFKYFANQDAIKFLINEIWPKINQQLPKVKLWLVGKNPGRFSESLKGKNVIIDSQVEDIRQAYAQADLLVVPMRLGSGTNIKVLEAMAAGVPVVTTRVGAEGIKVKEGKDLVVADKPEEFIKAVVDLIKNKQQAKKIGRSGQKTVKSLYDWSKIGKGLEKAYREVVNAKK